MKQQHLIVLVAVCVSASVVIAVLVAALAWSRDGGSKKDPYDGLPTTPPTLPVPPELRTSTSPVIISIVRLIDRVVTGIFYTRSDCYHANHFIRVTLMNIMADWVKDLTLHMRRFPTVTPESKRADEALAAKYNKRIADGIVELKQCNPDTKLITPPLPLQTEETVTTTGRLVRDGNLSSLGTQPN